MDQKEKDEILNRAQIWFRESIADSHIKNTRKLTSANNFNINPFITTYLANFLTGNSDPRSIAKALIYPRALGTSITTTLGTAMQKFTSSVLASFGSTTPGIDIEFDDQIDGIKKYCQLKAGPNTINHDDVETITGHFSSLLRLARTNHLPISNQNMLVGVLYGDEDDLSAHYRRITSQYHYEVVPGESFWHRLTGDADFFQDLVASIGEVAIEADFAHELNTIIDELSNDEEVTSLSSITATNEDDP